MLCFYAFLKTPYIVRNHFCIPTSYRNKIFLFMSQHQCRKGYGYDAVLSLSVLRKMFP